MHVFAMTSYPRRAINKWKTTRGTIRHPSTRRQVISTEYATELLARGSVKSPSAQKPVKNRRFDYLKK